MRYNMHIIQYQNCTNINGMIWHTVFSRLGLICLQLEFYMQSSMELHVVTSHCPLLIAQIIDIQIQYHKHIKWACWDKQLTTMGRKRDVMEAGEFAITGNLCASLVSPGWFGGGQDMLPVL